MKKADHERKRIMPRVPISAQDLRRLADIRGSLSPSVLARITGLPYNLVYNVVHARVSSVSARHYRMLFGESPPPHEPKKVDGRFFREMVQLWCYLNDDLPLSALHRQLYGKRQAKKADLRIFSGRIRTVDSRLERIMLAKFAEAGIDEALLHQWLAEMEDVHHDRWVPYAQVRPLLRFLQDRVGLHPTAILDRTVGRYEGGDLKRVSREVYNRALALKRRAERSLEAGDRRALERLREVGLKAKPGYRLYLEIRDELRFVTTYGSKSARHYLGRSPWAYENGRVKRIADWRARRILGDCDRLVRRRLDLPLAALPRSRQREWGRRLHDVLAARAAQLLSRQEGVDFEKRVLMPVHAIGDYRGRYQGLTRFDRAPGVLGMKKRAFDLMVARNCEIFRSVGTYSKRWYLPNLYLRELAGKEYFDLISFKYELLAKRLGRRPREAACMN